MKPTLKLLSTILLIFIINNQSWAGNTCNTATPISNEMSSFETFTNLGNTNSGVPAPPCGNYISNDFWFSTTVPATGFLSVVLQPGTMIDPAIAIYTGSCNNLNLEGCSSEDFCGDLSSAIFEGSGLAPGTTYYIRVWAVGGAPNGTFDIRVSSANPPTPSPLTLDALVGTASNSTGGCIQLTTTINNQLGCAWDSNQDDMTQTFEKNVVLNFGTNNGGADGITLGFQDSPAGTSACGVGGGGIGANGILNSLFFEFDTWDNGAAVGDLPQDHAAVFINGDNTNIIAGPIALNGGNIETGEDFPVTIKWNGTTFAYEVYFDNVLVLNGTYDISTNSLGGGTMAHWGTTGSTGGANNNQSICPFEPEPFFGGTEQIVDVTICEGESYFAGGANQTTTGVYTDQVPLSNGCQGTTTTNLTVTPNGTETLNEVVCDGDCVMVGTNSFCNTGTFSVTLQGQSAQGCDSIVTLNLQVLDPLAFILQNPIPTIDCANTSVFLDGSFSSTGNDITYEWSGPCIIGGWNTPVIEVDCAGNYTLVVTQTVGNAPPCTSFNTITVIDNQVTIVADAGQNQVLDCATGCVFLNGTNSSMGATINYLWSGPNNFSSTLQNPEACEAGTYTLLVFDNSNDCFASDMVEVTGSSAPTADAGADASIDCNNTTATLNGGNSTTGVGITLTWLDASGATVGIGSTFTTSDEGTYTLVVTNDATGCFSTDDAIVSGNSDPPNANAGQNAIITCTNSPVLLDGSGSDSGNNITLTWLDNTGATVGSGTSFLTSNEGTYTLVVTNTDNNCTSTDDVIVIEDTDPPFVNAGADMTIDCNNPSVTLNGNNSNSGAGYDLVWETPNGDQVGAGTTFTTSQPGTYILVVTDTNNGCSAIDIAIIVDDLVDPIADAGADAIIDCNNTTATLDGSNSNTGIGFELTWLDDMGTPVGGGNTFTTGNTGTYTLVVTNTANGCSTTDMAIISGNSDAPNADAGADAIIDCNNTSATLDGSNSDNGMGFELTWLDDMGTPVGGGNTFTTSQSGTYTLVVTNTTNGCSTTDMAIISGNSGLPNADAGTDMVIDCDNTSVTLDGSNSDNGMGFTLTWQNTNGDQVGIGATFTTMTADTYTLVVTNTITGCSASDDVIVSGNSDLPNADAGADMAIDCDNTSVTLDGSNSDNGMGFTLTWQNANGDQVGMGNTFTTMTADTYTLIVTNNANGCSASDDVIVSGNSGLPNADAGADMVIDCDNTSVTLDGSNSDNGMGFTLTWQNTNGDQVGTGTTFTTMTTGTYTLVVTNTTTGCSASDDAIVSGNSDLPNADAGADMAIDCDNTSVTLDGSNSDNGMGFTLTWQNANGDQVGMGNTFTTSEIGIYTLTVTNDATGCSSSDDAVVSGSSNLPTADAGQDAILNCNILQTILNGSNSSSGTDFTYEWQNSNQDSIGNEVLLTVTTPDTYTFIVTDNSNGCVQSDEVVITIDTLAPIADAGMGGTISCTPNSITLDGSNSSTGNNFTYEWFNSNNTNVGSGISIGIASADTFTLVVTNESNGCTASDEVIILQDTSVPAVFANSDGDLTCSNLDVTLDGLGSNTGNDIAYQWLDDIGTLLGDELTLTVATAGVYTFVVTNTVTNCASSTNVIVQENMIDPVIDISQPDTINCTNLQVTLDGSNSSTGSNFEYNWLNADLETVGTSAITSVSNSGFYTLVITDMENGCTVAETIEVIQDGGVPVANISLATDIIDCNNDTLTLSYSGPTGNNISYEWMNGNTLLTANQDLDIDAIGTYTLVVTNTDNGCSTDASVDISQNITFPQIETNAETITCIQPNATVDGTGSSDGVNFNYEWQNNIGDVLSNDISFETNEIGNYTLIVTNITNGCSIAEQVMVNEDISTIVSDAGQNATITCGTNITTLDGNNSTTGNDIIYQWTNNSGAPLGNNITIDVNSADTFILIVTNTTNGCADTSSVEVLQDSNLPTVDIITTGVLTCADTVINLSGINSTGIGTLSYTWTDDAGNFISNENNIDVTSIGNYNLSVTDMGNGCSNNGSFLVEENIDAPFADAGMDAALSCTVTSATLNGINSSIGPDFTYQWISPNGTTAGFAPILNTSESGTFTLVVTNVTNGCTSESTVNVTPSASQPNATILPPQVITCSQSQITLIGSMSSGSGTLTYQWYNSIGQPIGTNPNLNISQSGIYILDVLDSPSGCVASTSVMVESDITPPIADTNADGLLTCTQDAYIIDASNSSMGSGFNYEWQDENGNTLNNNFSYEATTIGTYNLIVTNIANGCTADASNTVTEDLSTPNPIAIAQGILTCQDDMVTIEAASSTGSNGSSISFEWLAPSGNPLGTENSINVNEPGQYQVIVTNDVNGCTAIQDVPVQIDTISPQPSIEAITNLSLDCNQNSLVVDGSNSLPLGNVTYEWEINNNVISNVSNPQIDEAGDLILTVTDSQNGCTASTSVTITQNEEVPNINIGVPEILTCNITTTELDGSGSSTGNDFDYEWTGPGTIINGTTLNPTINQAGNYILTITNSSNGCTIDADITVMEDVTPPLVNINPADEFDCTTFSITLDASNSSVGNNFTTQWTTSNGNIDNNANTLNPNISLPGMYTLEITNTLNGCSSTESITVTESNDVISSVDIVINDPICFGDNGSITVDNIFGGTPPYLFSIDFQPFTTNSSFNFLDAGSYDIIIEDSEGCQYSEEVTIANISELVVELPDSETIRLGESYEFQPQFSYAISEIDTFIWTPTDSLTCSDCPYPAANPINGTYYELTVMTANGCTAKDGMWLYVEKPREVFIPNVFTPNGDGINDIFQVFANATMVKQVNKFQVFTRWGELVFTDEDFQPNMPEHGWDGFFKGKKINPSVLVYYAEIEFIDGFVEVFKGDVTLK